MKHYDYHFCKATQTSWNSLRREAGAWMCGALANARGRSWALAVANFLDPFGMPTDNGSNMAHIGPLFSTTKRFQRY